jgi:cytochrome c553
MKPVRILAVLFVGTFVFAQTSADTFPPAAPTKQMMVDVVHPASNDILLAVFRGGPASESEWAAVRHNALVLAESGNMLVIRGRVRDQGEWMKDAKMLADAGAAAYKSAQAKDAKALSAAASSLDASCLACHKLYRPDVFPRETGR